jgi:predicted amidophosphoribosyltransferase
MPSVGELSALYENVLLAPRRGPDVCGTCFNFTAGYARCWACAHNQPALDAVAPISYSVAREQLHHALASYKRLDGDVARRLQAILAAILWRFLAAHEGCVAKAADTHRFDLVTTVPSGDRARDDGHPLRTIVGELVGPTRGRHRRLLRRAETDVPPRAFDANKFEATNQELEGRSILLIDDTWTTGASAQSAAAALKAAGAGPIAAVVIGRHLNREWHQNDRRLRGIAQPFEWTHCALCAQPVAPPRRQS